MKFLGEIIKDIRNRQNIDIYITVCLSLIIAILGFAQVANQEIISSAVLATLALVSISLLINRHENDLIEKSLTNINSLEKKLDDLASTFGAKVSFVSMDQGRHKFVTERIKKIVADATREVLVLDYNPIDEKESKVGYLDEDIASIERRRNYEALIEKVRSKRSGSFRYRRILQVPQGRKIYELLTNDLVFREHCEALIKLGERQPETANLKTCAPIHEGFYMLVDGRHLILDVNVIDPENRYFTSGGSFFIDDPTGKIVEHFYKFFERADAHSVPVKVTDLIP